MEQIYKTLARDVIATVAAVAVIAKHPPLSNNPADAATGKVKMATAEEILTHQRAAAIAAYRFADIMLAAREV